MVWYQAPTNWEVCNAGKNRPVAALDVGLRFAPSPGRSPTLLLHAGIIRTVARGGLVVLPAAARRRPTLWLTHPLLSQARQSCCRQARPPERLAVDQLRHPAAGTASAVQVAVRRGVV